MARLESRVVSIECREDGTPRTVRVNNEGRLEIYDVDFDHRGQGWYHCSGSGPWNAEERIALAVHLTLYETGYKVKMGRELSQTTLRDVIIQHALIEGRCIYCTICDKTYPENLPCEHIRQDDEIY